MAAWSAGAVTAGGRLATAARNVLAPDRPPASVTVTDFVPDKFVTGSEHASCIVYTRSFLSFPLRSARRLTLIAPVTCESDAAAPSVPVTLTTLHETLHVSGAFIASATGTIFPFGGQRVA